MSKLKISQILENTSKYYYYIYSDKKNEIIKEYLNNLPSTFYKTVKLTNITIIKVTIKPIKKKEYILDKKSPIKVLGGPIYGMVSTYKYKDKKLEKLKTKIKNKVYFPKKYIIKKWIDGKIQSIFLKESKKIALAYMNGKINQQLFYINTIDSIE